MLRVAAAGALLCLCATPALAQEPSKYYFRLDGGQSFPSGGDLKSFGRSALFGIGLGAKFVPWLRTDITVTGRTDYPGSATNTTLLPGRTLRATADIDSLVATVNAYYDFPKVWRLTPYVGAGLGIARNHVTPTNLFANGVQVGAVDADTHSYFAWRAGGGAAFQLGSRTALDIGYSYLEAGKVVSAATGNIGGTPVNFGSRASAKLQAHEIQAGLRLNF
jgi:opacity protein-like surface antigen